MLEEYSIVKQLILASAAMSLSSPFDLIRFRMQATPQLIRQSLISDPYKSLFDCFLKVYKTQGFKGFWKGNTSNLIRYYPSQAMNFFFKDNFQRMFRNQFKKEGNYQNPFLLNACSGTLGGWMTRMILYPFDYSRTRMANDISGKKQQSIFKCLSRVIKAEGIRSVYRGALISFYGIGLFRGTYFGLFDTNKKHCNNLAQKWLLSYASNLVAIFLTYPTDTVRRRIMMTSGENYKYGGFFNCASYIWKNQGISAFFYGGKIIFFQALAGSTIYFCFDRILIDSFYKSQ